MCLRDRISVAHNIYQVWVYLHFIIHYHDETERSAREAANIAESIYFQVTSYYEFEPLSKTHIIIKDVNDYANGAAYPPEISVLVKARKGGADYINSLLLGYEDPPADVKLDDGVYYNKYMYGNKIKMSAPLSDDLIEYSDGTKATTEQMAKDVVSFLMWAAEPHLEQRHKFGFRVLIYLIIISVLVYFSMKKIWSRIESKV